MKEMVYMKSYKIFPIILTMLALGLSGCGFTVVKGSGNVVSEIRQVSNFDAIAFSGSGDVVVTQGDEEGLKIEAEDNLMPYIRTEVRGKTLHLEIDPPGLTVFRTGKPVRFFVSLKQVNALTLSGSGTIYSSNLTAKSLDITNSGSGETRIDNLTADRLNIDVSGSGRCILKGQSPVQKIVISGSGDCNTLALKSKEVVINVSGSGKASVMATDKLDITISGSGDVFYTGTPHVSQTITGSGKIIAN
jgi:hypothetical protein